MTKSLASLVPLSLAAVGLLNATLARAGEVEVLHWWTSGGEAKAVGRTEATMQKQGHTWKDFAVAGGGGDSAMTVLKSRVVSGNAARGGADQGPVDPGMGRAKACSRNSTTVAKAEQVGRLLPGGDRRRA